ncbi:MAG: NAD(P)/FAD-dependent oxidoreductase [Candidatus Eiseniibacteriota bacterium]
MDASRGPAPQVVILGGGFGGLYAARALRNAPVRLTLVDRRNYHLFQPLLYQVATAGLSAPDIAAPIRSVLARQRNATVYLAEVRAVDAKTRTVVLDRGSLAYDYLIVAAGSSHSYFGHEEWAPYAPGLKDVEDAFEIRNRILLAFEQAEREAAPAERQKWLTFVVVGAGPTGVELAGAIVEIARRTLARDFRRFDPSQSRIVLVDAADRVLATFPERNSRDAHRTLAGRGVEVLLEARVTGIDAFGVSLGERRIEARTVLWAAGVSISPLARSLGVPLDRMGRVLVERDLSIPGHPEVFVIGDMAAFQQDGAWLPGVAQPAIQGGKHAAANVLRLVRGEPTREFRYKDLGLLATIGRSAAVAVIFGRYYSGFIAWAIWAFVHILWLIGFRNRIIVMVQWAWAYFAYARGARVIVDLSAWPARPEPPPEPAERAERAEPVSARSSPAE